MFSEVSAKESVNIESAMTKMLSSMLTLKNTLSTSQKEVKNMKRQKSSDNLN
jgi:hypothetical protein